MLRRCRTFPLLRILTTAAAITLSSSCSRQSEAKRTVLGLQPAQIPADGYDKAVDEFHDGTPDFLRLDDSADEWAFRRWFTFLAEIQYFTPAPDRPAEIVDCSA